MPTTAQVKEIVAPLLEARGLDLYDLELGGGTLRVLVDRDGGVDLDAVADATRAVSRALDEADPIEGRYTLEVSTPGLERPLRTSEHFARAVGERVRVKTRPGVEGDRRVTGVVVDVDDHAVTIRLDDPAPEGDGERRVVLSDIERARTVFEWGPAPRPGAPRHERNTT